MNVQSVHQDGLALKNAQNARQEHTKSTEALVMNALQVQLLILELQVSINVMHIHAQQDQLLQPQILMNVRHVRLGPLKSIELLVRTAPPDLTQKKVLKNALPAPQDQ